MKTVALVFMLVVAMAVGTATAEISLSSLDDFSATSEGWRVGGQGTWPTRESGLGFDGQPGYLRHFSDNSGINGKFVMWSTDNADWGGNYNTAGVAAISLWADNRAGNPLDLRVALNGPGGWFYSDAQTITNSTGGDDWTHLIYDLTNLNYVGTGGTGALADTITGVTRFEIFGGSASVRIGAGGALIHAGDSSNTVWLDHIQAVPEPSSLLLLLIGGSAGFALVLRRKRDD